MNDLSGAAGVLVLGMPSISRALASGRFAEALRLLKERLGDDELAREALVELIDTDPRARRYDVLGVS